MLGSSLVLLVGLLQGLGRRQERGRGWERGRGLIKQQEEEEERSCNSLGVRAKKLCPLGALRQYAPVCVAG